MPTLLFEIGSEELPASAVRAGAAQLPELVQRQLGVAPARVYAGPRRLAVRVEGLPERTPDEWAKGPPVDLREKAAAGFAKRHGVSRRRARGARRLPRRHRPRAGRSATSCPSVSTRSCAGSRSRRRCAGTTAACATRGPCAGGSRGSTRSPSRATAPSLTATASPPEQVEVPSADDYERVLREAGSSRTPPSGSARSARASTRVGEWSDPLGKLGEVVHLVEGPRVQEGTFDERFLALPERVIVTAMQSHQRYFPLGGNRFAFVANGGDPEVVRQGNERVLAGRLEDASFTFERDVKRGIDELAATNCPSITFFAEAGSFADKTERLVKLVDELGGGEASREAARLAKADQAAELVREFPDLEGYIGAEYARLAGYPEAVAKAIEEHYLPDSASGPLPETEAGKILAAAEKIDNLRVAFGLGHKPTGSRDPYGLRRAAIGLLRLATEGGAGARPHRSLPGRRAARLRRGAARGPARRPGRVRPRRAQVGRARAGRGRRARPLPRRARGRAARAGAHRLHAREPDRRLAGQRPGEPGAADRGRRGAARPGGRGRGGADRARGRAGRLRVGVRGRGGAWRPPSSASSTRCS